MSSCGTTTRVNSHHEAVHRLIEKALRQRLVTSLHNLEAVTGVQAEEVFYTFIVEARGPGGRVVATMTTSPDGVVDACEKGILNARESEQTWHMEERR